jgi:hypothetical protein
VVKLYVEGGGDTAALKSACREGFARFVEKTGLKGHMPRVVACGSRRDAYESYCTALAAGDAAMLLVDSEAPVAAAHQTGAPETWLPWQHLAQRPGDLWSKPANATDSACHLMAQCMESWLLADGATLKAYFGQGFKETYLPAASSSQVETMAKPQVYQALANATRDCKTKSSYNKGQHSFKLLGLIDPAKVATAAPWANRFLQSLRVHMGAN